MSLLFGSVSVTTIISKMTIQKTHDIRFRKGMLPINPLLIVGRNLKKTDKGMVTMAAASAAREVVLFQKKPKRKMANMPGEIKPTYSCIN
ncbi:hypothetical protein D3C73_775180 [compost metagenome]